MTGAEIKAARDELGMTLASFAFWLGLEGENGRRKIRRWESGAEAISGPAERVIKLALEHAPRRIETAPKDGTEILLLERGMGWRIAAWRTDHVRAGIWDTGFASEIDGDPIEVSDPIKWAPLPAIDRPPALSHSISGPIS